MVASTEARFDSATRHSVRERPRSGSLSPLSLSLAVAVRDGDRGGNLPHWLATLMAVSVLPWTVVSLGNREQREQETIVTLTRQHFELIASVLADAKTESGTVDHASLVDRFARELATTNRAFDLERFRRAAGA